MNITIEKKSCYHVHSLSQIRQSLQNLAKEKLSAQKLNPKAVAAAVAASKGASAPEPELKSVIDQVATNINSVYFLSSLGNKDLDPFRYSLGYFHYSYLVYSLNAGLFAFVC